MQRTYSGLLLFLTLLITPFAYADDCKLSGKVISVTDGDTIKILDAEKTQHTIRLAGIDAPERKQPYGKKAKKFLSALVAGKHVCIDWHKKDKYGRIVGRIIFNDQDINIKIVEAGLAWHFKKYQNEQTPEDRELYADAENVAKAATIGLWQEPTAIAPWEWRDGVRPEKVTKEQKQQKIAMQRLAESPSEGFSCDGKRFCKEMTNCAEARFYLTQCGLSRLDRDHDGIPCESICN